MVALLLASGCSQPVPPPDICDMPSGFRTWRGAEVEWSGAVVGAVPHGYSLACEKWRKGVSLDWDDDTQGVEAFEAALERSSQSSGVLRIHARGRLRSADEGRTVLQLGAIRQLSFQPMTEAEEERHWNGWISRRQGGGSFQPGPRRP